jgi:hypothetical protein
MTAPSEIVQMVPRIYAFQAIRQLAAHLGASPRYLPMWLADTYASDAGCADYEQGTNGIRLLATEAAHAGLAADLRAATGAPVRWYTMELVEHVAP